ncbi:TIGR02680 family protein [Streptomyces sp. NBC_01361]|uniref:TIGR02680 family protein n=1 Tax=Streptomyces sp. NBC_01361 TaxID=2903838 RepID=UPI002E357A57|nr:TIGR02680 family protein [Streptomyces sp. NBC_01361]
MNTARWRPSRAGVLNIWRYYDEVFAFHHGRLLLRGPNGTGKSKALEVLLPFLFDASLKPNRLSTFGGSERTMHWNLMGEGASGVTRVGYVWLEFRSGDDEWFTIGARLQATARTTSVGADFFTVRGRVGHDLSLVGEAGQPLGVAALREVLAGRGEVHDTASDYRAAVRQTLFPGLSAQRYDALITALLQLRTPKLSERLDPSLLSTLLSRALPPLDRDEIAELAEGFERLDRRREELARMDDRVEAAQKLAVRQKAYAQRVLRARAGELISATTEMDNRQRAARELDEAYEAAVAERETAEKQSAEQQALGRELRARVDVLTDSQEYRHGRELGRMRSEFLRARGDADRQRGEAEHARGEAEEDSERAAWASEQHAAQQALILTAEEEARATARAAHLASVHAELAASLAAGEADRARQLLAGAVRGRLGQIADVRAAAVAHRGAVRARDVADEALEEARDALAEAGNRREKQALRFTEAVRNQGVHLEEWARGCMELRFGTDAVRELVDQAADETEVLTLIDAAARAVERELTVSRTASGQRHSALEADRAEAVREAERLKAVTDLPPDPPRTRTGDRSALPGAPLWKLIAFRDGVPGDEQAAVEAALEASGLLDAWVGPHGGLLAAGHDTFAEPDWTADPSLSGPSLANVLRPEPDGPVAAERIERLLASVAYGEKLPGRAAAAIGGDGTWRLAATTGSWAKAEPAHIGASARQRARRRRIDELAQHISVLDTAIQECEAGLAHLDDRQRTLDLERHGRPDHSPVTVARRALDRAEADAAARDDAVRAAMGKLSVRESEASTALRALGALAAEHRLPSEEPALDHLTELTEGLRERGGDWVLAAVRHTAAAREARQAEDRAQRTLRTAQERAEQAQAAEDEARSLGAALEEAERTAEAPYQDVLRRIEELRAATETADRTVREVHRTLRQLDGRIGALGSDRTTAAERHHAATGGRDTAAQRLRHCVSLGLAVDAGASDIRLGADAKVTAALEAARAITARWSSVAHSAKNIADALERLAETRYETARILGERADVHLEAEDDLHMLTASVDGAVVGAAGLLATVTEERDRGQDDITAGERGLFDRILTGDTRRHLASRIRQATELVDEMNARLERVRTASRVAVQLLWQVDPTLPPGTRAARDLLLKDPVRLTDSDHEALHQFFRERIEEARTSQHTGSWEEQLAQVLDYTAWHQFVVRLDRTGGDGWQLLTKKLHGALSGGEKAIALHLPLFAAVAAHYHSVPEAPRLILLDEVFVGVDTANRGQVFALLSSLDLDLLLTSDHEWCTYRELDGIAVHQLIADTDDDAVTTARFVWDGAGLTAQEASPV